MSDPHVYSLPKEHKKYELPKEFTFPFSYEPHPISELAAKDLQLKLSKIYSGKEIAGKMYGVLIVRINKDEIAYLAAFSGQLETYKHEINFVPAIHDRLKSDEFFKKGERALVNMNRKIEKINGLAEVKKLKKEIEKLKAEAAKEILEKRDLKQKKKEARSKERAKAKEELNNEKYLNRKKQLDKESIDTHYDYKKLNEEWNKRIGKVQSKLAKYENELNALKKKRKQKSHQLQTQLFNQYQFLNAKGKKKSLLNIFEPIGLPPAGAGDCAAPKMLQYAYSKGYEPLAMAEFWWGKTPKSQLRVEGRYYPACAGKCKPILGHMLEGLQLEEDPILKYDAEEMEIKVIYEDDDLLIINKPAGLLSVSSKLISDAVAARMQKRYPEATGPMVAHRLDKLTSGLMIITKSLEAYKIIQQQFIQKTIHKEYMALLEGKPTSEEGTIDLPLAVDEYNRPMQMVDREKGKESVTKYKVIKYIGERTLIQFTPVTGRTHQLRVHSAHIDGLNAPIVGDTLYGDKDKRLMLHAAKISFDHPKSGERLTFFEEAEFAK